MRRAATVGILALATLVTAGLVWWASRPPAPAFVFVARDSASSPAPPTGGRLMAASSADLKEARPLAADIEVAGTPETSFDGLRILFAGRRKGDTSVQVWEVRRDGRALRQITNEKADCTDPHYLPEDKIAFTRTAGGASALYACDPQGGKVSRITFNVDPILNTMVLPDGRIMGSMRGALVTVNSDGTGVSAYTGTAEDLATIREQQRRTLLPAVARPRPTGHVTVVDPEKRKTGLLFCLNAYLSDEPGVQALPEGSIKKVRVWAAASEPRVLGEAPVEPDGSFLLEVPADTPLRVQTLDARGKEIGRGCTWVWVRANESRGCVGCHESRDLIPENHVQMAIKKKPVSLVPSASKPGK